MECLYLLIELNGISWWCVSRRRRVKLDRSFRNKKKKNDMLKRGVSAFGTSNEWESFSHQNDDA